MDLQQILVLVKFSALALVFVAWVFVILAWVEIFRESK